MYFDHKHIKYMKVSFRYTANLNQTEITAVSSMLMIFKVRYLDHKNIQHKIYACLFRIYC